MQECIMAVQGHPGRLAPIERAYVASYNAVNYNCWVAVV